MYRYRITKYNPAFRDEPYGYKKDEWTAISDIGKSFEGITLHFEEYMRVEDAYVTSVKWIMKHCNVISLRVSYIEKRGRLSRHEIQRPDLSEIVYTAKTRDLYKRVKKGTVLTGWRIEHMIRLMLREELYAQLVGNESHHKDEPFEVFIGYDYLMGIHTNINLQHLKEQLLNIGMYLENPSGES
ncbi:hypothetical protein EVJ27_07690 [Exiguobacterium sp. SH3S2]|uniref:hypothetical protein n=1 Tax=unclassified Exiguobacterium TaxID=2644629 RepID=UPI00103E43F0|nr:MULTISPECIES: hypothetical protein [unclassified Exiguobacterium]TCI45741.1 hypothetical protein EVJ28_07690 [Exiguobacterium sp. SH3S3]TCI60950.1 hypothetical protein EVJ27_07690 [Exiguobacterium sp. SH3S2]